MRTWYAVVMNRESDWGTGSHDLREAVQMARNMDAPLILEIDEWEGEEVDTLIRGRDY